MSVRFFVPRTNNTFIGQCQILYMCASVLRYLGRTFYSFLTFFLLHWQLFTSLRSGAVVRHRRDYTMSRGDHSSSLVQAVTMSSNKNTLYQLCRFVLFDRVYGTVFFNTSVRSEQPVRPRC
jgi:hypothetical protein